MLPPPLFLGLFGLAGLAGFVLAQAPIAVGSGFLPPALARCLAQRRPAALEQGAPLPTDSNSNGDWGTCAARCDKSCLLLGDFDGDGQRRELAVASRTELLLFHDVERLRDRRVRATLVVRLPIGAPGTSEPDEVAPVSMARTVRFADEVGLLRDGRSPLPQLPRGERMALGLLVWRGGAATEPAEPGDDDVRPSASGELLVTIFDEAKHTYRLQRILQLGGP